MKMKVVAIKELMWTYHPIPADWTIASFEDKDIIQKADIFVQTNIKGGKKEKKLGKIYDFVANSKKPYICLESAVFRYNMIKPPHPKAYHRWSWTSYFRNEGDYCNADSPDDRWIQIQKEQQIKIKDWKFKGDYVLFLLQRPGDTSLKNLYKLYGTYENFVIHFISQIRKHTDRNIIIRPHPSRRQAQLDIIENCNLSNVYVSKNISKAGLSGGIELYEDFKNAWCVVGFNSNALTESVCEGIPTFSLCESSMAWECSNHPLNIIENPNEFDRTQWLNNLGYCQWTEEEALNGLAYRHLLKKFVH